jgi:HlyD family secretion protein
MVKEGQQANFTVDAYPDKTFPAHITEVHFASQTVEGVVTYETLLRVDNSELLLRPGMTATADIIVRHIDNARLVPNAALHFSPPLQQTEQTGTGRGLVGSLLPRPPRSTQRKQPADDNDSRRVWQLVDNQPVAIAVKTGATNGVYTEILEGDLQAGMEVIVDTLSYKK